MKYFEIFQTIIYRFSALICIVFYNRHLPRKADYLKTDLMLGFYEHS
jgi:hypothetical protein